MSDENEIERAERAERKRFWGVIPQIMEERYEKKVSDRHIGEYVDGGEFGLVICVNDTENEANTKLAMKVAFTGYLNPKEIKEDEYNILEQLKKLNPEENYCARFFEKLNIDIEQDGVRRTHRGLTFNLYGESLGYFIKKRLIKDNRDLKFSKWRKIAYQLTHAVAFLQKHGIVHCDIKPDNIVFADGPTFVYERRRPQRGRIEIAKLESYEIRLVDFGSAVDEKDGETVKSIDDTSSPYISPERLLNNEWSFPLDVWSLGCVIFEMFHLKILFNVSTIEQRNLHLAMIEKFVVGKWSINFIKMNPDYFEKDNVRPIPKDEQHILEQQALAAIKPLAQYYGEAVDYKEPLYELLKKLLALNKVTRITAMEALDHYFFDAVKDKRPKPGTESALAGRPPGALIQRIRQATGNAVNFCRSLSPRRPPKP